MFNVRLWICHDRMATSGSVHGGRFTRYRCQITVTLSELLVSSKGRMIPPSVLRRQLRTADAAAHEPIGNTVVYSPASGTLYP